MLSTPQRRLDNADTTYKDDPDNGDHDSFVETLAQEASPNISNTEMEERTLLSALPPRLNLRKVSGQSTPDTRLELRPSVTQSRQKGAILRSGQVSNPMQTPQSSTAQLRSNMDSLAKYIEEKLAAIRGTRSKGKPGPPFLTIYPQPSGIGSLQTQYRSHGVYNNKRAGMSEFSLDDQTALQKVTDFDKQAEPHTAQEEQRSTQQTKGKVSKFRELVNSIDAKEFEELPTFAAVRISEVSTLHLPEPFQEVHQQSTSQGLEAKSEKNPTGVPKRKPLPEGALCYSSNRAPLPDAPKSPAPPPRRPQPRRQYTTSYLNRSLPPSPSSPAAPRKSNFPPEVKDPNTIDSPQPSPPPPPPRIDLTPDQKYQYLRQQIAALSEVDGRPVGRLWECLLKEIPDAEERYTLFLQHRAHTQGTTTDYTGSNDMFQDGWEACDHEEAWRAEKREGALKALEGRKK